MGMPPMSRKQKRLLGAELSSIKKELRSVRVVPAPGTSVLKTSGGTVASAAPRDGRTAVAVITTTCTARTGTSPAFTFGQGQALLLSMDSAGVTSSTGRTITIYNDLQTTIPAAAKPVILLWVNGLPFVIVADCS